MNLIQKATKEFMSKMMSWLLLSNIVEAEKKKRSERKKDGFRKKLMIPESEISEWSEYNLKSKIGNIFVNGKTREEHYVKINETDPSFYEHYEKNKVWQRWT